jgi:hypothetical protein
MTMPLVRSVVLGFTVAATSAAPVAPVAAEESHLVIVVGLGGEPKYTEAFHELATSMIKAAEKKLGLSAKGIAYLGEKAADPSLPVYKGRATRENVQKTLGAIARAAAPGDLVLILLIGHGSFQAGEARFNLPGPDMSAADFAPLLAALGSQQVVLVNTSSASGDFVKALSAKGRTIVTATKSGMERNQTEFPSYFVEAFAEDKADADKDQRVSILEAFVYARREVERFYEKGRLLATEHAILDDNGDGAGTSVPADTGAGDGALARTLFLGGGAGESTAETAVANADPRVAALRQQRRAVEQKIAALKARKEHMTSEKYDDELEGLLLELARSDAALRGREGSR